MSNPMRTPMVEKVIVHMGVGESGQHLVNAEEILKTITGQGVVRCFAKRTLPAFSIKKNEPIGCKVTLRGQRAQEFLGTSFEIIEKTLSRAQFDSLGNVSFGIEEHTDFPGMRYDPNIGVFGMDVTVVLKRPGERICKRRIATRKIPTDHRVTVDDAIAFLNESYGVEVM
ncbi:50S ribosomal protein L5 [Methanosarcina mazei]|uniref:Large ribosomal subunit protein uL5 n=6 Tax=Methanosarcina mazei TaxID=2209 RepID=A0A0F8KTA3_METMZ|nr:50S ribosomal protein L5 [Methanosarcina mazei]KKG02357.1 50S ribosomal protein L5 [Methanosarcina mazei]KKG05918.1 50S ribosomal protein L5 [Methanosarcina mazei]KKG11832.1 50S ribosomal protein L5 [Methanosarcina mazei]KKG29224.1 50S ribosomal protein L5 [Methanosarcina mazei]